MRTQTLDGKALAKVINDELREESLQLQLKPALAVLLVGNDPASTTYVRTKQKSASAIGFNSQVVQLPGNASLDEIRGAIDSLNANPAVDGFLVQLPLPRHIDPDIVIQAIDPNKDLDGLHPTNIGKLCAGTPHFVPCTPQGILTLLERNGIAIEGKRAVIMGRSDIVGKPLALLLLHHHATVTICHSRTEGLPAIASEADILVSAMGRPGMITADYVKQGAVVIDVGISPVRERDQIAELFGEESTRFQDLDTKGYTLVGDIHPQSVRGVAGALTPVPGGVGPLTVSMLLKNALLAARNRATHAKA